jgi:lysyl-tRNA synthetase class II
MLEAYCAFGDYETMMETVESLITTVAQKVLGTLKISRPVEQQLKSNLQSAIDILTDLDNIAKDDLPSLDNEQSAAAFQSYKENLHHSLTELKNLQNEVETEKKNHAQTAKDAIVFCHKAVAAIGKFRVEIAKDDIKNVSIENTSPEQVFSWAKYVLEPLSRIERTSENLANCAIDEIDLGKWERLKYKDLVRDKVKIKTSGAISDWFNLTPTERRRVAIEDLKLGNDIAEAYEDFEVTNAVFSKFIEPTLIQPTFVTHLPKELVPLAKLSPDDPATVEVFECCINGQEISPGYTEQNDPIAQRTTLEHQAGGEQQKLDEDFLVALEHGMPPAGGIGIGIDRLCMMLLGQESIRDVILFPQLKPK